MKEKIIEVLYALTDRNGTYSKFVGTSICSLLENTKAKVRIHIFCDSSIEGDNAEKFQQLVAAYGQELIFYNVRQLMPEVWETAEKLMAKAVNDNRYTEAALYRLLAPQILPEEITRLIYLDADTLINLDIKDLWQEPIGFDGMAAVFETDLLKQYGMRVLERRAELQKLLDYWETLGVKVEDGFNSGVLLMDLGIIRKKGNILLEGLKVALGYETENNFYDQNILNFYFAETAYHLPRHYNILLHWDKKYGKNPGQPGIYHYMGRSLGMDENDIRDTLYYDYFLKTPWAGGKFLCHFHYQLKDLHTYRFNQVLVGMQKLLANLLVKKPVIAVSHAYMAKVRKMLGNFAEAPTLSPKGIFLDMGEDENLRLYFPYDVDEYFYIFFVKDYVKLQVIMERGGLPEQHHYMDGRFLLEKDCLEKNMSLSRVFETM